MDDGARVSIFSSSQPVVGGKIKLSLGFPHVVVENVAGDRVICKLLIEPSGVYFYRMTAGSFTETKKLVLLR